MEVSLCRLSLIHICVLALDLVDVEAIKKADFTVAIDCVNSVGGIILPELLERLGAVSYTHLDVYKRQS